MKTVLLLLATALAGTVQAQTKPPAVPTSIDGLPIGAIPKQQLPAKGCAAFLWSAGTTHALVAMITADPAQARLSIDGAIADYPRVAQSGAGGFGFSGNTEFQAGGVTVTLDMTVETKRDLADGATIPSATLRIDRAGKDTIVLPVGGLIGCA